MQKIYLFAVALAMALTAQAQNCVRSAVATPLIQDNAAGFKASLPTELITEQPEGTLYKNMYRASVGYTVSSSSVKVSTPDGIVNDMVVGTDGSVYIKDPFSTFLSYTWLKGEKGTGDTIVVNLPQAIYQESGNTYYAWRMVVTAVSGGQTYLADPDNQTMKFVWRNDSLIKIGDELLGLGNGDGAWAGYGDREIVMNVVKDTLTQPLNPDNTQQYTMRYTDAEKDEQTRVVEVAVEEPNIYMKGFYLRRPDAWIKGTLSADGKAVFPSKQFLGLDEFNESYSYFFAVDAKRIATTSGYADSLYFADALTIVRDSEGNLTTEGRFVANEGMHNVNARAYFNEVTFEKYANEAITPADPTNIDFYAYDDYFKRGTLQFDMIAEGTNGETLNQDKLFYNVYFGDNLYTFKPATYKALSEAMTDVPYNYADNSDFYVYGNSHLIYFFEGGFTKAGVQAVYKGGNEVSKSNIVWKEDPTAINAVKDNSARVSSVTYTDISGRRIDTPQRGLYIVTKTFADGTTTNELRVKN